MTDDPKSDLRSRMVKFKINPYEFDRHADLYAKMLRGFLVMHIETNMGEPSTTFWAAHPDARVVPSGHAIPEWEWTIVTLPDRIWWRLTRTAGNGITKYHMAHGFMLTSGLDEVGLQ